MLVKLVQQDFYFY